jgi:hypothetical protein
MPADGDAYVLVDNGSNTHTNGMHQHSRWWTAVSCTGFLYATLEYSNTNTDTVHMIADMEKNAPTTPSNQHEAVPLDGTPTTIALLAHRCERKIQ